MNHPDMLELDTVRAGEADPKIAAHVENCAACRQRLAGLTDFAGKLRGATLSTIQVPRSLDQAIVAGSRRRRSVIRWWVWPAAAAACAALAAGIWLFQGRRLETVSMDSLAARGVEIRGDVDGSGQVDILDAYILALRVERKADSNPAWDMDGDGSVDRDDADAVAKIAVSIEGGQG